MTLNGSLDEGSGVQTRCRCLTSYLLGLVNQKSNLTLLMDFVA